MDKFFVKIEVSYFEDDLGEYKDICLAVVSSYKDVIDVLNENYGLEHIEKFAVEALNDNSLLSFKDTPANRELMENMINNCY
jgi:hypothetical protein